MCWTCTKEKLLVLGGNGFVGSHVCKEALDCGLSVSSLTRSGRSSVQESWASRVTWHQGKTEALNLFRRLFFLPNRLGQNFSGKRN
ncbi:PREDICTED: uncharacterized protein At1g32220, chloroplastic-like isoform X2 [Brassica oleracea var. oleracea]|uniref:uncharacterized protein At1g32220, chloroplastic-like isoform X2 n=1 Tax=Brassica oleracea var. oleracea TaxID=109376 RepID=UPI0006A70267|nr:PREDICTED: uncharacterized protein At1g32220, chloroplastic-like isoform X2 [Brassica oleracea var. oleracea]